MARGAKGDDGDDEYEGGGEEGEGLEVFLAGFGGSGGMNRHAAGQDAGGIGLEFAADAEDIADDSD